MGFPKHLDALVRGGDEWTLTLSTILAEKKQEVLLVDEHSDENLDAFVRINYLEKRYLQELGKQFNIDPLINIERLLKVSHFELFLNNKMLSLVAGPAQNGLEFKRKLKFETDIVFDKSFDNSYFELSEKVLQLCLKGAHNKAAFQRFLKEEKSKYSWAVQLGKELKVFFPGHNFFVKGFFCENIDPELYYIFLTLAILGPSYRYKALELRADLLRELKKKGGHYKKTSICNTSKQNKEWVVELESFEGLVYPKCIYTEQELVFPRIENPTYQYSSWNLIIELGIPCSWDRVVLADQQLQGGFVPYCELLHLEDNKWCWQAYLEKPRLAHPEQLFLFLEESLHQTMSVLPFLHHYKKGGEFYERPNFEYYYEEKSSSRSRDKQRGVFASLLRLSNVIMSS